MSEAQARRSHDLMAIVQAKVRPERERLGDNPDARRRKRFWWQWGRYTPALFEAIRGLERVLVTPQTSNAQAFAFVSSQQVFAHTVVVFPNPLFSFSAVLQSRTHQRWAAVFGPTMKDDIRYTPSDCFETFPFPDAWESNPTLERVGREYYEFRGALMIRNNEGLTKTYNRFHNPDEQDPDILKLRELHDAMDRAVLDAYGWTDIRPRCEFILEYEDEEDEMPGKPSKKRKPWRYRWPDEIRDEVLGRLLELNAERARKQALTPTAPSRSEAPPRKRKRTEPAAPLLD